MGSLRPVRRLGAFPGEDGRAEFRVWAPSAGTVDVATGGARYELERSADGTWSGDISVRPGDDYLFVVDGEEVADPCSRFQPAGVDGPSRVVDTRLDIAPGPSLRREGLVLYELHVGAFTEEGTFVAAIPHLPALADLGVTAIELMPVATFPGERNWGYDGIYAYAPHPAYGGPEGLARLVDAAHRAGLSVILDLVYNHVGPGAPFAAFGPWFTSRYETPWGDALDYTQEGVREWAIQNACLWVRDYAVDGLRLDAVFAVKDESPSHVLAELADRVHAERPDALVIGETEVGDRRPIERWGHDAQWSDAFHHELHVLLTGERDGYYGGYGSVAGLASEYRRTPAEGLVYCSQNHDQVGNRALGDRPARDELELRAACLLFAPQVPLLFMGEEYGERRPFQFFSDHADPVVAEATREGRKREFARFASFAGAEVPDPQDPETFRRSKLSRDELPGLRDLYRDLIRLRKELPQEVEAAGDDSTGVLRVRRGSAELTVDFRRRTWELET
jgi:maltooligosyltrehalose trehalohydrolase